MNQLLQGQSAIVTGGTSGIGKAIALLFAAQGARVAIFGTNDDRGHQAVDEIRNCCGEERAFYYQVNVADAASVNHAVQEVLTCFGQVDILVNNAGITRDQLLLKMTEEDWDRVLDTNAKSAFLTVKALTRPMMKARKGKIINMSSVIALTGNAGQANYAASKGALISFTKAVAKELASRNICVNCIAPGYIETPMTAVLAEAQRQAILEKIPLNRLGKTEDIANMALFLASSHSDYITGQVFTVDGGMVM